MVKHARQQIFGGPDQTLCGLTAEGLDTVFGCWNEGVFGEVAAFGKDGGPDEMRATTGFDCPECAAVAATGGGPVFATDASECYAVATPAAHDLAPSEVGFASDHEHAGHPHFRFAVTAECLITDPAFWVWHRGDGSTSPMSPEDIRNQGHEEHALIYTDGHVAVTLHEYCYAMWYLNDGATAGVSHWKKGEWRLTPESVEKIKKAAQ